LRFRSLSSGFTFTCGVTTEGRLYCWGSNYDGTLGVEGLPRDFAPHPAPMPVSTTLRFTDVDAGWMHACAIAEDGSAHCWGSGFLGDGTNQPSAVPRPVAGGLRFRSMSANTGTCGSTVDGVVYCWGYGANGLLGDGTTVTRQVPTRVMYQRR
jgi:alpha-tubulin suppressor-like RCC1 family protein